MTPDTLDDLLDRSAPVTRTAVDAATTAMILDARAAASPSPKRKRTFAIAGALALVLTGTTGVAVATDGFTWGPWLQDPLASYSVTLPSGLECDVRIAHYSSVVDPAVAADVNRIVEEWWRSTDVAVAAKALTPQMIDQMRAAENTVYIAETGETVPGGYGTEWYDADQEYSFAFDMAIGELESSVLRQHGYTPEVLGAVGLDGGYGVQCFDEDGQVTIP